MKLLQLSQIWIYPIKSLGGVPLSTARVLPKGLEYDRRWMLVDEQGMCMTQRTLPRMALFKVSITPQNLVVTFQNDSINIPLNQIPGKTIKASIWDDTVTVQPLDGEPGDWFSTRLGVTCRLVQFPEGNPRPVQEANQIQENDVSLADGLPFLIIGQTSLDDLNHRLVTPVPMNRFRPNFVFIGGDAYEEDRWHDFTIGTNHFTAVKRCERCILTTIDQDKGKKGKEPLRTLSIYRQDNNKVYFGTNAIAVDYHEVSVADKIQVSSFVPENIS
jgi:MOSC domain-containing protein